MLSFKSISVLLERHDTSLTLRYDPIQSMLSASVDRLETLAARLLSGLCFYDSHGAAICLVLAAPQWRLADSSDAGNDERSLSTAASVLWEKALLNTDVDDPQTFCLHKVLQERIRTQLDEPAWNGGFNAACDSILYHWPSKRKFRNIIGGFWEEFEPLHTHIHYLATCLCEDRIFQDQPSSYDPGDQFKRLLVYHTWYVSKPTVCFKGSVDVFI